MAKLSKNQIAERVSDMFNYVISTYNTHGYTFNNSLGEGVLIEWKLRKAVKVDYDTGEIRCFHPQQPHGAEVMLSLKFNTIEKVKHEFHNFMEM